MRHLGRTAFAMTLVLGLTACTGGDHVPPTSLNSQSGTSAAHAPAALNPEFNRAGNVLISDQFNNRIIEVDPDTHQIVWQFGKTADFAPGPHTIVGPNDAQRVGRLTLIAGTGVPAAPPLFEPHCAAGCPDNRVILVSPHGKIVWQYGQDGGVSGTGPDQINTPVQATFLPGFHVLITDQANERIIEVNRAKQIVWQYGTTGTVGMGPGQLSNPNSAELLENGNILISDENNNRVIEVNRAKQIVWQYPDPVDAAKLSGAAFSSRLENGNTLITDSNNNRIIEVDHNKNLVWTYSTADPAGNANPLPTRALRLRNGDTLISDQFNDRVIQVHRTSATGGTIVFDQGKLNVIGDGFDLLNAPYDAKVNGDYTGLTAPFAEPDFSERD